jgi:hypothetical protein
MPGGAKNARWGDHPLIPKKNVALLAIVFDHAARDQNKPITSEEKNKKVDEFKHPAFRRAPNVRLINGILHF